MKKENTPEEELQQESASENTSSDSKTKDEDIQEITTLHERTIAALSYVGFLAIVPFYLKKDSKFCRFHGKQGLTFSIIFFFAKLFMVLNFLNDLVYAAEFAVFVFGGLSALSGRWKKMPFIYETACKVEETLTLKTKEEEEEDAKLKPDQIQDTPQ